MNILDNLETIDTGIRTPMAPPCRLLETEVDKIPETYMHNDFSTIYFLRARLGVQFRANPAQYDRALDYAKKHLTSLIYSDVLGRIDELRHLAMSGEQGQLIKAINDLQESITK